MDGLGGVSGRVNVNLIFADFSNGGAPVAPEDPHGQDGAVAAHAAEHLSRMPSTASRRAILARAQTRAPTELAGEVARVAKAHPRGDRCDRQVSLDQQARGAL